jgi:hypothetical protein
LIYPLGDSVCDPPLRPAVATEAAAAAAAAPVNTTTSGNNSTDCILRWRSFGVGVIFGSDWATSHVKPWSILENLDFPIGFRTLPHSSDCWAGV